MEERPGHRKRDGALPGRAISIHTDTNVNLLESKSLFAIAGS
jgi:hypothetical protein